MMPSYRMGISLAYCKLIGQRILGLHHAYYTAYIGLIRYKPQCPYKVSTFDLFVIRMIVQTRTRKTMHNNNYDIVNRIKANR